MMMPAAFCRTVVDGSTSYRWLAGAQPRSEPRRGDIVVAAFDEAYEVVDIYPRGAFDWTQADPELRVVPLGVVDVADVAAYIHYAEELTSWGFRNGVRIGQIAVLLPLTVITGAVPYAGTIPDWYGVVAKATYLFSGVLEWKPVYRRMASTGELWFASGVWMRDQVWNSSLLAAAIEQYRLDCAPYYATATLVKLFSTATYRWVCTTLFSHSNQKTSAETLPATQFAVERRRLPVETAFELDRTWLYQLATLPTKRHPTEHFRWPFAQQRLVDWTMALWPLVQSSYVILWIVDWLDPMSLWPQYDKSKIIEAVVESVRRIESTRASPKTKR